MAMVVRTVNSCWMGRSKAAYKLSRGCGFARASFSCNLRVSLIKSLVHKLDLSTFISSSVLCGGEEMFVYFFSGKSHNTMYSCLLTTTYLLSIFQELTELEPARSCSRRHLSSMASYRCIASLRPYNCLLEEAVGDENIRSLLKITENFRSAAVEK